MLEAFSFGECIVNPSLVPREEENGLNSTYSGSFKSALGYAKDPMVPIIGRMVGKGSLGSEELKETWRTGVALIIEWIACKS